MSLPHKTVLLMTHYSNIERRSPSIGVTLSSERRTKNTIAHHAPDVLHWIRTSFNLPQGLSKSSGRETVLRLSLFWMLKWIGINCLPPVAWWWWRNYKREVSKIEINKRSRPPLKRKSYYGSFFKSCDVHIQGITSFGVNTSLRRLRFGILHSLTGIVAPPPTCFTE